VTPPPDTHAEAIFARARAAIVARAYPKTIAYKVRISGLRDGTWTSRTYASFERWPSERVIARAFSEEEIANPSHPRGIDIGIMGITANRAENDDILGIPKLAPTYAFGLGSSPEPDQVPSASGALKTIGSVVATARNYDVRLAGEETVAGMRCWHLTLRPLGNPGKYRVRDLWIEEGAYQLVRLHTYGNFTNKDTGAGWWTVDYAQTGGSWYLTNESSFGPVETDGGTYERLAVQFVDIRADPDERLDFGAGGANDEAIIVEPSQ